MTQIHGVSARHRRRVTVALAGVALALFASEAAAWVYTTCNGNPIKWAANRATMAISTTSFPIGSGGDTLLQNAMANWNGASSKMQFLVGRDTDTTYSHTNGVNEVVFGAVDASALAVTFWRYGCSSGFVEADIVFDYQRRWTGDPWQFGRDLYQFEATAVHELGHALGLGHETRWLANMNPIYHAVWVGHNREFDPLTDDRGGARALYGVGTPAVDLATLPFDAAGLGEPVWSDKFEVAAGSTVSYDYTFGSWGTTGEDHEVSFFLSTNDIISPADVLLARGVWFHAPALSIGTFSQTVQIPASTAPGLYYLGYLLDQEDLVTEVNESNANQELLVPITVFVPVPTVTPHVTGRLGLNGWYTAKATLTWQIDTVQALTSQTGCQLRTVKTNTKGVTFTCTAVNVGGTTTESVTIKRDASPPTLTAVVLPVSNAAGWRKAATTVTFVGDDPTSGVSTCSAPVTFASEGTDFSATGFCTNGAGLRSVDAVANNIDIDLTNPRVNLRVPANGAVYAVGSVVNTQYTCTDALSGVASCTAPIVSGAPINTSVPRTDVAFQVKGVDAAGNVTRKTVRYSVR